MPVSSDIEFFAGDDCKFRVKWKHDGAVVDVSGYSATFKLRKTRDAEPADVTLTEADGIALDSTYAVIQIGKALSSPLKDRYVWGLLMTSPGGVETTVKEGGMFFRRRIPRADPVTPLKT